MEQRRFLLKVGDVANLQGGILGFNRIQVAYAGMPSEGVYSLALLFTSCYNSLAYNMFFPLEQTRIEIARGRLEGVEATPEQIMFRYVK